MPDGNETKLKYKCYAYPHPILYIYINLILLIVTIGSFCALSIEKSRVFTIINIFVAVIFALLFVCAFIYTTFSGWNSRVFFVDDGAYKKHFGKIIEWKWEDVSDFTCGTHMPWILRGYSRGYYSLYPKFKVTCKSRNEVLIFTLNSEVDKYFKQLCPNEEIKLKFIELISACDFDYPHKYDNVNLSNDKAERANVKSTIKYMIYSLLLLAIGITGLILYIKDYIIGCIICFAGIGILLISELIVVLIQKLKNNKD